MIQLFDSVLFFHYNLLLSGAFEKQIRGVPIQTEIVENNSD